MISFFHRFLSSWFGFNRQQRNGVLVLCLVIVVLFIVRLSLHHLIQPKQLVIADFSQSKLPDENTSLVTGDTSKKESGNAMFIFDPNTVSKDQLVKLGFKEKTANTFINYRNKGAHFEKKEDVKKVYGVSEALYKKIEPFIFISKAETKVQDTESTAQTTKPKTHKVIELNSADSLELLGLRGIGPSFTKRILKYRSLLGGFYSTEQLREVYGLQDSTYQLIKNDVRVDASLVIKLDINNENFKELNKHPYLSFEDVKAIFNYRRKNGPITTPEQLKQAIADPAVIEKLKPYLSF